MTHNIMVLVGNGFDLQVLHQYDRSTTTSYQDFYFFLMMKNIQEPNLVFSQMRKAYNEKPRRKNWSDIEAGIESLVASGLPIKYIRESVDEIQGWFSQFLNYVVDTDLLTQLSSDAMEKRWTQKSLSRFLWDIKSRRELDKVPFGVRRANHELYNFQFINFNYTALLDNYLHLDSEQFDPLPNSTVETNFTFNTNPHDFPDGVKWNYGNSVYLECQQVIHPHAFQSIPRSLLFGIDGDGMSREAVAKVAKPYWARAEQRYSHMFNETSLFVIYGCSMGSTDAWWWTKIADALLSTDAVESGLLIYKWNEHGELKMSDDEVREEFFLGARIHDRTTKDILAARIVVVSYADDDERVFLNTKREL